MLPEALQLEQLRQQIEDAEYEIGSQSDYIDRGRLNASQKQKAEDLIAQMRAQSKQAQAQFHEAIVATRTNKPEAFTEWINYHKSILQRIMAEKVTDANTRTRQNVAKGALADWEEVLAGEKEYVNINWHFLKDYKAEVRKLFHQSGRENTKTENTNKSWWQFWK